MKLFAVLAIVITMCIGCKPISALPDPSITPTVSQFPGR